jgi:DNA-binding GntR family transcriptional regulator
MLDVSFGPVRRTLLRDEAYRVIRDAIIAGTLAPGEIVRDADLAERLGLSRAPVREALARLVDEGLVESKPQSYTRVTRLDLREVRDAVVVVRAMHDLAVRAAVPILREADVLTMRAANAQFAAAVRVGDVEAALAADDALHDVLVAVYANRAVAATIERFTPLIRRLERRKFATLSGQRSVRLHEELIEACAAGNIDGAVAVSAAIWSALLDVLTDEPETPNAQEEPSRRRPGSPTPVSRPDASTRRSARTAGAAPGPADSPIDADPNRIADSPPPAGGC